MSFSPEEIERCYLRSAFIKEICVFALASAEQTGATRLYAVIVPDLRLLREKRIVNVGDLLRFEIEGQSIHLPPQKRVLDYEISFNPLPRTPEGALKRDEIERRVEERKLRSEPSAIPDSDHECLHDGREKGVWTVLQSRARGRRVHAQANLEIDLGLDSMDRVELLTGLEQQFGIRFDESKTHELFTVRQLLDAIRSSEPQQTSASDNPWSSVFKAAVAAPPAATRTLLDRRPIAIPIFFLVSRVLRLLLGPSIVHGREHLPARGPYIISPNHQGYLDPFIVCSVLPYRVFRDLFFVGAAEYFETPATRWLARKINLLPVDPDANLVSAMQASAFGLQRGKILMLFPEGERSIDGTVKRFKKGAPILAQHLSVPIVPVAIRGAYELWPRNRSINWLALLPFGHRVRVQFGSPMRFAASSDYAVAASRLRAAVEEMWSAI